MIGEFAQNADMRSILKSLLLITAVALVPAEWVAAFARDCALAKARGETLLNAEAVYGITPDGDEFRYTDQQRRLMMLETAEAARSVCAPGAARAAFEAAQRAAQDS